MFLKKGLASAPSICFYLLSWPTDNLGASLLPRMGDSSLGDFAKKNIEQWSSSCWCSNILYLQQLCDLKGAAMKHMYWVLHDYSIESANEVFSA